MASSVVDSIQFREAFGTRKMREIFSHSALGQRYRALALSAEPGA